MKIAVIGSNGQLGNDVVRAFVSNGDEVRGLTHSDIELADFDSVSQLLRGLRPQVLVNTAAMHHVENCEREPGKAFAVNGVGARNLVPWFPVKLARFSCTLAPTMFSTARKEAPTSKTTLPAPQCLRQHKVGGGIFCPEREDKHLSCARPHFTERIRAEQKGAEFRRADAEAGEGTRQDQRGRQRIRHPDAHPRIGAANVWC